MHHPSSHLFLVGIIIKVHQYCHDFRHLIYLLVSSHIMLMKRWKHYIEFTNPPVVFNRSCPDGEHGYCTEKACTRESSCCTGKRRFSSFSFPSFLYIFVINNLPWQVGLLFSLLNSSTEKCRSHFGNLWISELMLTSFMICRGAIESTLLNILQITNHTVGGEGGQLKPALGESWKSMPHVRLLLERDPISDVCQASVMKHTSIVRL